MEPVAGAAFPAGRTGIRVRADIGGVLRQSPAVLPSQARDHSLHVPAYAGPARHANRSEIRRAPAPAHPVARHTSAHKMMSDEPHKCRCTIKRLQASRSKQQPMRFSATLRD